MALPSYDQRSRKYRAAVEAARKAREIMAGCGTVIMDDDELDRRRRLVEGLMRIVGRPSEDFAVDNACDVEGAPFSPPHLGRLEAEYWLMQQFAFPRRDFSREA